MVAPPPTPPDGRWVGSDPQRDRPHLTAAARTFLARELGGPGLPLAPAAAPRPTWPTPSTLPDAARRALGEAAGDDAVRLDPETRLAAATGASYLDLLARRRGGELPAPDAVVLPADAPACQRVVDVCARHGLALIPWGGGTSVVGGLRPARGGAAAVVAVDTRRLDTVRVDPVNRTAAVGAGVRGPALEAALAADGLTAGHFPQSFERSTVGGWAATRSAGQASGGYGRLDANVVGVTVATPRGPWQAGNGPSAAGPDLLALALGSEGAFGVLSEVTLRLHTRPDATRAAGWMLPDLRTGVQVLRRLAQDGPHPAVLRLSDPDETRAGFVLAGAPAALHGYLRVRGVAQGCLLVAVVEGTCPRAAGEVRGLRAVLREAGAVALGRRPGHAWQAGRYGAPYLRDALMDAGVLVETLETAAGWDRLEELRHAVRRALRDALTVQGTPPLVLTHLSHTYPHAASLYVTVLARALPGAEAAQWVRAKDAATRALLSAGGTLSHHHGVGADHAPYLTQEIGPLGVEVLRAVKRTLDPDGLCNPGTVLT